MGTLITSNSFTNNYSALKCLVSASFCGKSLTMKVDDSSKTNIIFEPLEEKDENLSEYFNGKMKKTEMDALTDPLSIGWLLSRAYSPSVFGFGDQLQGKSIQFRGA